MLVKDLKNLINNISDDTEVLISTWDGSKTILRSTHRCCNFEYQNKNKQLWLSGEGLRLKS